MGCSQRSGADADGRKAGSSAGASSALVWAAPGIPMPFISSVLEAFRLSIELPFLSKDDLDEVGNNILPNCAGYPLTAGMRA